MQLWCYKCWVIVVAAVLLLLYFDMQTEFYTFTCSVCVIVLLCAHVYKCVIGTPAAGVVQNCSVSNWSSFYRIFAKVDPNTYVHSVLILFNNQPHFTQIYPQNLKMCLHHGLCSLNIAVLLHFYHSWTKRLWA